MAGRQRYRRNCKEAHRILQDGRVVRIESSALFDRLEGQVVVAVQVVGLGKVEEGLSVVWLELELAGKEFDSLVVFSDYELKEAHLEDQFAIGWGELESLLVAAFGLRGVACCFKHGALELDGRLVGGVRGEERLGEV